jgi:hypothetical protein
MNHAVVGLTAAIALFGACQVAMAGPVFSNITELAVPAGPGAQEPNLFAMPDGRVLLSWTEPLLAGHAVMSSVGGIDGFAKADLVNFSNKLFLNWADFPSIAAFSDGTLAAHWLEESRPAGYEYDIRIALSKDDGRTWAAPVTPHRDNRKVQHGFVSMVPVGEDLLVVWLDGRAYGQATPTSDSENDEMQLRATLVSPDGMLADDILLDTSTCSCCQTAAAVTGDGVILIAYRDRTLDEIRDISVVRRVDGVWTDPVPVHDDGWEISGCPVNGPAVAAHGADAVVAWFTGANGIPAVKIAFSNNGGATFDAPLRIDQGQAVGRVDAVMLADGSALITWLEWTGTEETLKLCRARPKIGCEMIETILFNGANESVNFPKMVAIETGVFLAWTDPESDTIRIVYAGF